MSSFLLGDCVSNDLGLREPTLLLTEIEDWYVCKYVAERLCARLPQLYRHSIAGSTGLDV